MGNERSKYLSYLLRHKPESAGLILDKEGWCDIADLISKTDFTFEELKEIAKSDLKQRYTLSAPKIRANQGHSTSTVKLTFKNAIPPVILYHGTSTKVSKKIMKEGLKPMNRHHVHLSADLITAQSVGNRRKSEVVIFKIDAKRMLADGVKFYISENGVWLVDAVQPTYLEIA